MDQEKLLAELQTVFGTVFRNSVVINGETDMASVPDWDSLRHMTLISEIERRFAITFSFDEASEATSVQKILQLLEAKRS
jgi:acyl carrier protein